MLMTENSWTKAKDMFFLFVAILFKRERYKRAFAITGLRSTVVKYSLQTLGVAGSTIQTSSNKFCLYKSILLSNLRSLGFFLIALFD